MLNLFRLFQSGGMGGSPLLPTAVMDEPVVMMSAFALMADFDSRLRDSEVGALLNEDDRVDAVQQRKAEANAAASWGVTL